MPLHIGWSEIAVRLGLAFVAALLVGLNRGKRGEAAGLRTNLLVCLAAAVAMIQVNQLLDTEGKNWNSFAVLDLMRLPLGILTGMGFIGAGAILKRGNMVMGVTTAASLWFITVMGLCFGGGQIGLGLVSLVVALFVLTVLKWLENRIPREYRAVLSITATMDGLTQERIQAAIRQENAETVACSVSFLPGEDIKSYELVVGWRARGDRRELPAFVERLAHDPSLRELKWVPEAVRSSSGENHSQE